MEYPASEVLGRFKFPMYRCIKNKTPPLRSEKFPDFGSRWGVFIFYNFRFQKKWWGVFIFYKNSQKTEGGFLFFSKSKLPKKSVFERFRLGIPPKIFRRAFGAHFFQFRLGISPKIFRRAFGAHFYSISPWYTAYTEILKMTTASKFNQNFWGRRGVLFFTIFDLRKKLGGFYFLQKFSENGKASI